MVSVVLAAARDSYNAHGAHALPRKQPPTHKAELDPDSFGSVVRFLREQANESQEDLAAALGINQPQVSLIERSKHVPREYDRLRALADHFGVTPGYMLELAKWPGAFRRGVPAAIAEALRPFSEQHVHAMIAHWRHVLDTLPEGVDPDSPEGQRRMNIYISYLGKRDFPDEQWTDTDMSPVDTTQTHDDMNN